VPDLLLEIGTEELPPSVVAAGEEQLAEAAPRALRDLRLSHGAVEVFATPRRLAFVVRDVADAQERTVTDRRGPPADRAFDDTGAPTPAAVGFARSAGIDPSQLERRETDQGAYVYARVDDPGLPAAEVLPEKLAGLIAGLSFPRTMKWDASEVRFPRPIRWLVALLGEDTLPVRHGDLVADRFSTGHRVFHPGPVEIAEPVAYERALSAAGVVARRARRRELVREQALEAASSRGGSPVLSDEIVDEVTDIVERPVAMVGSFDAAYLEIPPDVLVTAMQAHQRYFALRSDDGSLAPGFVVISNADPSNGSTIVAGNERVLRARLEDARFFFEEDRKVALSDRVDRLSEVVVHPRLGTLRDKSDRLQALASRVATWMGLDAPEREAAGLAGRLAKADLLTHLVYEFPELQGTLGGYYARIDPHLDGGAVETVAGAIAEQYLPRGAGDALPTTPAGRALAIADRLDTLVGYIGIGLAPTGSEDPYALRRAANGLATISHEAEVAFPLDEAVAAAWEGYAGSGRELRPLAEVEADVRTLIASRAEALLQRDAALPRPVLAAALSGPWTDLPDLRRRTQALGTLHERGALHQLAVVHERCHNLTRQGPYGEVDPSLLEHPAEGALYEKMAEVSSGHATALGSGDHVGALEALLPLVGVVETFFDRERGVMVMAEDAAVRSNRQALLATVAAMFAAVADFSRINPADLVARGSAQEGPDG